MSKERKKDKQEFYWCSKNQVVHKKDTKYPSCKFPNQGELPPMAEDMPYGWAK